MRVVVLSRGWADLAAIAREWGVHVSASMSRSHLRRKIAAAYRRELDAEMTRRAVAAARRRRDDMPRAVPVTEDQE